MMLICQFNFHSKSPFRFSCKTGIMKIMSLNFYLFGEVFISPSFLKDSFTRYRFLLLTVFFFNILNMSSCYLLVRKAFVEKSADNLIGIPLYVTSLFKILSLSLIFKNWSIVTLNFRVGFTCTAEQFNILAGYIPLKVITVNGLILLQIISCATQKILFAIIL